MCTSTDSIRSPGRRRGRRPAGPAAAGGAVPWLCHSSAPRVHVQHVTTSLHVLRRWQPLLCRILVPRLRARVTVTALTYFCKLPESGHETTRIIQDTIQDTINLRLYDGFAYTAIPPP